MQNDVVPALRKALSGASLLGSGTALLAAVSGGADSLALLLGLAALRRQEDFCLYAVHVEHGLRGEHSLADADFVAACCKELDIPLYLYHAALEGAMDSPGAEARAREARRHFFARAMEACGADALLTAHHQSDQAETLLMRLLRGAGSRGLGSIRACVPFAGGIVLRPFLALPGSTFPRALAQAGYAWREDESNGEPYTLRNRLRLEVMPLLQGLQPRAEEHMAQAAQCLQWDEDCLGGLAEQLLAAARQPWQGGDALVRKPLLEAHKAVAIRALRAWVMNGFAGGGSGKETKEGSSGERALSHQDSLRLYELLLSPEPRSVNLPGDLRVDGTAGFLHLRRQESEPVRLATPWPPQAIEPGRSRYQLGSVAFTLAPIAKGEPFPCGRQKVLLPRAMLMEGLVLRTPCPGDRIHAFGASGGKPLRRYFTDHKVDAAFRPGWPVLAWGAEILWVAGIGASEKTRLPVACGQGNYCLALEKPFCFPDIFLPETK